MILTETLQVEDITILLMSKSCYAPHLKGNFRTLNRILVKWDKFHVVEPKQRGDTGRYRRNKKNCYGTTDKLQLKTRSSTGAPG